jgi:hypothetical protein
MEFICLRVKVTGRWRKLHHEKLRDLHSSSSILRIIMSRKMSWAGHVARILEKGTIQVIGRKPDGKRPL